MHFRILLKSAAAGLLAGTGTARRLLARNARGRTGILMYHRVLSPRQRHPGIEPGMFVDSRTFRQQVAFLKQHCRVVSLDRILEIHQGGGGPEGDEPMCALTFDDGWADFYEHAYPVLKAHQVPATVFLPTDYIGTGRWFWTDRLGFLLHGREIKGGPAQSGAESGHPLVRRILSAPGPLQARLAAAIAELKALPQEEIEEVLQETAAALRVAPAPPGRAFLTWEEVREMAGSGLVSFGSHTAGHAILTTIGEAAVAEELVRSRQKLEAEKIVSRDAVSFCYPNGNHNGKIARQVREAGYCLAVTTRNGWNGPEQDRFALNRIPIHNDMTASRPMFLSRLAGIF